MSAIKTLFVSVDPAFPPVSGADLRIWQHVVAAQKLGPVALASIGPPDPGPAPASIQVQHIAGMDCSAVWSSDFDVTFTPMLIAQFRLLCAQFKPDVIVLSSLPFANLLSVASECARAVMLNLHNVESDLIAQEAEQRPNSKEAIKINARSQRIRELEMRAVALAHVTWVCSALDRDRLVENGADKRRIVIVPNGVPRVEDIMPRTPRADLRAGARLLFLGHLNYQPNIDAAMRLVEIMPAVWKRLPGAHLTLAGRNPHPTITIKSRPGKIDVVPNPSSTVPLLRDADLVVMPLRSGGGTRIKALEAMAWGLPMIATARAIEGLDLQDGVHVRIAETMPEFVAAVCEFCENPQFMEKMRVAAAAHAMAHFGRQAIDRAVHQALGAALRYSVQ